MKSDRKIDPRGGNLIFLISQPRSGSTLLQRILGGHEDIATTSEPWIALHPLYALREKGVSAEFGSGDAREGLRAFLQESGMSESYYETRIASFLLALYGQSIGHKDALYFLDKTPRYYNIIPELREIFPRARFIILFRHPLAVLNSILKTWVQDDLWKLNTFYRDLVVAPGKLLDGARLLSERCLTLKYEDLVTEPSFVLQRICEFLGLTCSESLLEYGSRGDPEWTLGDTTGIHKYDLPNEKPRDSWKNGFYTDQTRHLATSYIAELGSSTIQEMGYSVEEMTSFIKRPEGDEDLIQWTFLMRKNENLLDEIEFDLYRYPEHMGEILGRYVNLHHKGLFGRLCTRALKVMRQSHRLLSKRRGDG